MEVKFVRWSWLLFIFVIIQSHADGSQDRVGKNPEITEGLFEGDIIIKSKWRTSVNSLDKTWPRGIVPYVIEEKDYGEWELGNIQKVMAALERDTAVDGKRCVSFKPRTDEVDYIYIHQGSGGCASEIGVQGGMQEVELRMGCFLFGTLTHEMLHTLGFWHEQSRDDRDEYIHIVWNNIKHGHRGNFIKQQSHLVHHLGMPYDYDSIMHYGEMSFSKNKGPTIIPLNPYAKIGQRKGLSEIDLKKIRILYGCIAGDRPTASPAITPKSPDETVFNCNFDDDEYCRIRRTNWMVTSGFRSQSSPDNPKVDHTFGRKSSRYLLAEREDDTSRSTSSALLPEVEALDGGYCLVLWYYITGNEKMLMVTGKGRDGYKEMYETIVGRSVETWRHMATNIYAKQAVRIKIDAMYGSDTNGVIAIDDIQVFPGKC